MIIQCDHCSAKFRMDDSKLDKGPVKVRCAKCKEVFVVQKAEEPAETFQLPTGFESTPTASETDNEALSGGSQGDSAFGNDGFSVGGDDFAANMDTQDGSDAGSVSFAADHGADDNEFDWKDSTAFGESGPTDEFGAQALSDSTDVDQATPPSQPADSLGEFDFGDIPLGEPAPPVQPTASGSLPQDDFAIDFGEVSFSEGPAAESAPAAFDFSFTEHTDEANPAVSAAEPADSPVNTGDDFVLSFNADAPGVEESSVVEGSGSGSTAFGDFDFGEVEGTQEVKPQSLAPLGVTRAGSAAPVDAFPDMPLQDDELPPASLTTRKKRGSLFPFFVIIGAILLVIALAGSGVYFFGGPKVFSKVGLGFLVEWYGKTTGEEGDISLRNVKGEYLVNKEAGELFVVRGEALNNYKKPRASIQIKVSLLGSGGSSLKTKTAFCGNSLSNEQLVTLPLTKIEEVMNNQFGDSLANLGVKPGNVIPFVVVVSGVPKEAIDFSVQVGGSTVATQ